MSLPLLPLAIFGLGGPELLMVLAVVLLFFGGAKLPALAKGLGQSVKEFKKASKEPDTDADAEEKKPAATATPPKPGNN